VAVISGGRLMGQLTLSCGLLLCSVACLSWRASGQSSNSPFSVTWLEGKCVRCKTAANLYDVHWISRQEAWGIGIGRDGVHDYSIVHTTDSGKTWKELPNGRQYMGSPAVAFLDSAHGWYSCWNVPCGGIESRTFRTVDGGRHWQMISNEGVVAMAFADQDHGVGKAFGIDDTGDAVRTVDGGRTWSKIEIPHLKKIGNIIMLSGQIAWITDRDGADLMVFRTIDGGRSWQESRTSLPIGWPEVRQISFVDQDHGWIVLKRKQDAEIRLLATSDGGRAWRPVATPPVRNHNWWSDVVGFVSESVGFVFEDGDPETADYKRHEILYTADGGATWQRYSSPYSVNSCQMVDRDLICSADKESHFGVLTIHPR
jgi:photosystem II stability/assembly factor-like uncharacterized protein